MASRVNTKFVVLLSLTLGAVFVCVAGVSWYVITKSASALAADGDAAAAQGDYKQAAYFYSKAVAKDQSSIENLEKWRDALLQKVPESQVEFRTDYEMYRGGILRQLASLKGDDLEAHHAYLGEFLNLAMTVPFQRVTWDAMIELVNSNIRNWGAYDPDNEFMPRPGVDENGQWNELRRYSGIAYVMIMNEQLPLKDHEIERARLDLEAALAANPDDVLAIRFYALWHFNMGLTAEKDNDPQGAAEMRQRGVAILDEGLRRQPDHPDLLLRRLAAEIDIRYKQVDVSQASSSAERNDAYRAAMEPLMPLVGNIEQAMISQADEIDASMVATFERLVRLIDRREANALGQRLMAMLLERDPSDFDAMMLIARYANESGQYADALEPLNNVLDLPAPTVGLRGKRLYTAKQIALIELINAETVLAVTEGAGVEPNLSHIDAAIAYREQLNEFLADDNALLMMADAKIKLATGDMNAAQRLLVSYNKARGNQDPEGLMMAADIAERANQLGKALELYEKVVEIRPTHVRSLFRLGVILSQLNRYEESAERLREVIDIAPQHEEARERLKIVEIKLPDSDIAAADPILRTLVIAEDIRFGANGQPADPERALGILEDAIADNDPDPRLAHMTAQTLLQLGRSDEAMTYIDEGLAEFPTNRLLNQLKERLQASDSLEATIAYIDQQNATDLAKVMNKFAAARKFGEEEQANSFLDQAIEMDPTDAGVIEQAFFRAMRNDDIDEARRLAVLAEEHDVDRANGLAFRSNVLLMEGDLEGAEEALNQAVALGTATSRIWRQLGDVRWSLGDVDGAIEAFSQSLRINPNDVEAVTSYVTALAASGANTEALRIARENRRFVGQSPRLMDAWLRLEGAIGNRDRAIAQRQLIQARTPDDRDNLIALTSLLVDARRGQEARTLINQLRAEQDSLGLVEIDARLRANRGDLQAAVDQYRAYLATIPESERTSTPMIMLGQFLLNRGVVPDGLAALDQARQYPDEGSYNANLIYGDALSRNGRFEEALGALQASIDEDRDVVDARKRMSMVHLGLNQLDEAEAALAAIDSGDADLELMLMRANIAGAKGDKRLMRSILDEAVAAHRESPMAYLRRADANKTDPQRLQDVIQDLNQALRLRPGYAPALQLRAAVYFTQGREDDAINDLQTAVTLNPMEDGIRNFLLTELLERGRDGQAHNVASAVVKARPGDRQLLLAVGDAFAGFDRWERAAPYYAAAWALEPEPRILERYAEALIQLEQVDNVSKLLNTQGVDVNGSAALLMVRARMHAAMGNMPAALRDAAQSLDMLAISQGMQEAWYKKIRKLFEQPEPLITFLGELAQTRPDNQWLLFFQARLLSQSASPEQGLAALESLAAGGDEQVEFMALNYLGEHYLRNDDEDKAADAMERALALRPNDMALNNNIAFLYAERLDKPDEALPFALKAAELAPGSVNVLDTLAATYQALDQNADAKRVLTEALRISMNDSDRATVLIRLARVAASERDRNAGLDHLDDLKSIMDRNPGIREAYEERYRELMGRLR